VRTVKKAMLFAGLGKSVGTLGKIRWNPLENPLPVRFGPATPGTSRVANTEKSARTFSLVVSLFVNGFL